MWASKNVHEQPTGRRRLEQARRVQLIIAGMTDRFTGDPFLAMSDHYNPEIPGHIGSVVFRPYEASPVVVDDNRTGYDLNGNFHCHTEGEPSVGDLSHDPVLKTELNRWQFSVDL